MFAALFCFLVLALIVGGCEGDDTLKLFGDFFSDEREPSANSVTILRDYAYREQVQVSVNIVDVTFEDVAGLDFSLYYDTNVTMFEDFEFGTYFEEGFTGPVEYTLEPFSGRANPDDPNKPLSGLDVRVERLGPAGAPPEGRMGGGTAVFLRFQTQEGGRTLLDIEDNQLFTPTGDLITGVSWYSGLFIGFLD